MKGVNVEGKIYRGKKVIKSMRGVKNGGKQKKRKEGEKRRKKKERRE